MQAMTPFLIVLLGGALGAPAPLAQRAAVTDEVLGRLVAEARQELAHRRGEPRRPGSRPPSESALMAGNAVRVTWLAGGVVLGSGTARGRSLPASARLAAARALDGLELDAETPVTVLVELALPERAAPVENFLALPQRLDGGRQGFVVGIGEARRRVSATQILASGHSAEAHLKAVARELNLVERSLAGETVELAVFDAVLALGLPEEAPVRLFRGGRLVPLAAVGPRAVQEALARSDAWYAAHQRPDGSLPYLYNPVADEVAETESSLIRQAFNVASMGALAAALGESEAADRGRRALDWLLESHYLEHPRRPWGYLSDAEGEINLGCAAAGLWAILQNRAREAHGAKARRLAAFLHAMRREDGGYLTQYRPPSAERRHEYYPGEAQLALAQYLAEAEDPELLAGVRASYDFYRAYWREHRTTPFIPWQTQANVRLYRATRERQIASFVFEMNDLLVAIQERGEEIPADLRGRFFNPEKRGSGYPHVSSTGVYLEGLLDAFDLARELGDEARARRYRTAIVWGLRNLLQMQIRDRYQTWCMPAPERAVGGFRSRWDYPGVRIDNQQHANAALAKAVRVLTPADYRLVQMEAGER
jgi:hypothetical protein